MMIRFALRCRVISSPFGCLTRTPHGFHRRWLSRGPPSQHLQQHSRQSSSKKEGLAAFAFILGMPIFFVCSAIYVQHRTRQLGLRLEDGEESLPDLGPHLFVPGSVRVSKQTTTKYRPLLYKSDIRLLVLNSANDLDDDIHIDIIDASLESHPPSYEALSYAWGDPDPKFTIYQSGDPVTVPANLYSALRYLRYRDADRVLWVDSLCIDQSDLDERSQQVRLMGDVFSEADRVVVYLGEETRDVQGALSCLDSIYLNFKVQSEMQGHASMWFRKAGTSTLWRMVNSFSLDEINWDPVRCLLRRPWLHRLWIYQEVANAKSAVVVCGHRQLSWPRFSGALRYLAHHDLAASLDGPCAYACSHVDAMETTRSQVSREPLFNVVVASARGGCKDPRDKIFAVMSIAEGKDIFDWEYSFDYSLSVYDLFRRFAIWDIIRCQSLRSLACAPAPPRHLMLLSKFPSWAPDWSRITNANIFSRWKSTNGFSAAGNTEIDVWFTQEKTMLHAKGRIVDSIEILGSKPCLTKITSLFVVDEQAVQRIEATHAWLRECWQIAAGDQAMTSKQYHSFWETMLCGLTARGHPAPKAYSRHFLRYLKFVRESPTKLRELLRGQDPILPVAGGGFAQKLLPIYGYDLVSGWLDLHQWFNRHCETHALVENSLQKWSPQRRFCRTNEGRLARVPNHAAPGDTICVLHGSEVPHVLRLQEDGTYVVVGECYVHGLMHGEALELPNCQPEYFRIR